VEDEPKYATLEAFKNAPDSKDAVFYIDNDQISAYDAETGEELLIDLHPHNFVQQAIELLGFSYESV
jgi:hypothetical protein